VSENVLVALVGLGWSERVAAQAIEDALAAASIDDAATVGSLLRLALANLGPQQAGAR
jgi:Holliday junction DNA helicase RuvA